MLKFTEVDSRTIKVEHQNKGVLGDIYQPYKKEFMFYASGYSVLEASDLESILLVVNAYNNGEKNIQV